MAKIVLSAENPNPVSVEGMSIVDIESMKARFHEAGHAVISRLTGFPVSWVSVDENFICKNSEAIRHECNHAPAVCMTISSNLVDPILNTRKTLNVYQKNLIIGYCMHTLAGPQVEIWIDPRSFDYRYCMNDFMQVEGVLTLAARGNKVLMKDIKRKAFKQTTLMLTEKWHLILAVADALAAQGTILAAELDEILGLKNMEEAA